MASINQKNNEKVSLIAIYKVNILIKNKIKKARNEKTQA
jgi:hypothetical protein